MRDYKICIIGLGYVGLPLAVEFGKKYAVLGFDINQERISELMAGKDHTLEMDEHELKSVLKTNNDGSKGLFCTSNKEELRENTVYIVTVPTPIDNFKKPDLTPLEKSSETISQYLKKGDIVIYESTTFPGCTEEICVPILEKGSGLKFNQDFFCGYSPERINPGDKVNTLTKILKITSGSTPEIAEQVDQLYNTILEKGTHKAPSMKVAEAAKVVENCQRDLNISFVNELALICDKVGIDTNDVIDAAGTKWNFLKYKPGLVGGHCIGVDPYYLVHKAEQLGYYPEVILSGRRVNEHIGAFVANKVIKLMIGKNIPIKNSDMLVLGITFKENCPDIRNSRVIDIVTELEGFGGNVTVYDPWADAKEVKHEYGIDIVNSLPQKKYRAIILAVSHTEFLNLNFKSILESESILFDVKSILDKSEVDGRL
ncbi:MAG: nucleotide sugar dehydrogenase [Flavobacteriales bacterium]|nr:nucleotide sugar dehydrogenase [Flavobacteriales bacterium]